MLSNSIGSGSREKARRPVSRRQNPPCGSAMLFRLRGRAKDTQPVERSWRMNAAAILSTARARLARETSCAISERVTAAVESRSSQNTQGRAESGPKLRAKARAACALGPSDPSMLSGKPMISAAASNSSMSQTSRAASLPNFVRRIVTSGVAIRRSTSERARPMVLAPRSAPISLCPARCEAPNRRVPRLPPPSRALQSISSSISISCIVRSGWVRSSPPAWCSLWMGPR